MNTGCRFEGCTVADTTRCALENDPSTCPNRILSVAQRAVTTTPRVVPTPEAELGAPVLESPVQNPSFPRSTTLGSDAISKMMSDRYVTVVGVLGYPDSGKTACLASLYLLVSNGLLRGWTFADSRSLMGFEEISRGARRWNEGQLPDQMTVHTEMMDDRQPGFLHLRLKRADDGKCVDLALPDLPGEWTKDLVATARVDRFEFLKSADVLWVVVDGRTLLDLERRQGVITRLGQLGGRLKTLVGGKMPRLLLAVTHRDAGEVPPAVIDRVQTELAKHQVSVVVVPVAPFSDRDDFKAGFGLADLIDSSIPQGDPGSNFWPDPKLAAQDRGYLSYRRER